MFYSMINFVLEVLNFENGIANIFAIMDMNLADVFNYVSQMTVAELLVCYFIFRQVSYAFRGFDSILKQLNACLNAFSLKESQRGISSLNWPKPHTFFPETSKRPYETSIDFD